MGIRKMKRQDEDDDGVGKGDEEMLMRDAVERLVIKHIKANSMHSPLASGMKDHEVDHFTL